ncbi:MAG: prepilin-type N-terminal cleavage/methylation domain-containing protein [Terriglobales bacterium]|jgi:prepilin-type N-terminal cleavage/methylation domain-containing protein
MTATPAKTVRKRSAFTVRRRARFSSQHGFKLIELMIVVSVILLFLAICMPNFFGVSHTYNIRSSADSLAGLISVARMTAAQNYSRTRVSCSSTTSTCTLFTESFGGTWPATANGMQAVALAHHVSLAIPTAATTGAGGQSSGAPAQGTTGQTNPYYIEFNSRGMAISDSTGTAVSTYAFYLDDSTYNVSMAVAVDLSGRVTEYMQSGSSYTAVQQ